VGVEDGRFEEHSFRNAEIHGGIASGWVCDVRNGSREQKGATL